MRIRVLDAATIGRIAAGEVVERPASIAKELMENALDAGATHITVEIRDGGIAYLRVTDDGGGIAPEDVRMAFENHATSKFSAEGDLSDIRTLGFRGEALPSIAAVAKVEMETMRRGAPQGARIRLMAGGRVEAFSEAAIRAGTTVTVRDLFCNVPARRAFLGRASQEGAAIAELVSRFMLGNPSVAFRFINNHRTALQTFGDGNMRHAALNVLGHDVARQLIDVDEMEGGLRIAGWIGVGGCARPTRSQQCFFINGRLVRCPQLSQALEDAARGHVLIQMHPICALQLTLPAGAVDVNVHPNKLEVRFRDEEALMGSASALFARGLGTGGMMNLRALAAQQAPPGAPSRPAIGYEPAEGASEQTEVLKEQTKVANSPTEVLNKPTEVDNSSLDVPPEQTKFSYRPTEVDSAQSIGARKIERLRADMAAEMAGAALSLREGDGGAFDGWSDGEPDEPAPAPGPRDVQAPGGEAPPFRIVGVAFQTYVLVEYDNALMIIDQHAAHERLLYERYTRELDRERVSQVLLTPVVANVSASEMESLIDNQTMLAELGYDVEPFGEGSIRIAAIPQLFGRADLRPLILSLLDQLQDLRSATSERRRKDIVRFACKRAVKAGDRLTNGEIAALIASMLASGAPPTCPHGRPVIQRMTRRDMEKLFKRT